MADPLRLLHVAFGSLAPDRSAYHFLYFLFCFLPDADPKTLWLAHDHIPQFMLSDGQQ